MIANPVTFAIDLCEALGIDPEHVSSLRIEIDPQSAPRVTIVRYVMAEDAEHVKRLVEKYDLVAGEGE